MIFGALCDLYDRFQEDPEYDVAPRTRSYQKIAWAVVIDRNGDLVDIQDVRQPSGRRLAPKRVLVLGETKPSGSGLNPCFLWDNPAYLLGWDPEKPERAERAFAEFRRQHLAVESEIGVDDFSSVCRFLEKWEPSHGSRFPILEEGGSGFAVFQIRGETHYVHDHPGIAKWWDARQGNPEQAIVGQCLVTGRSGPIARLHGKVKGLAGAQPSGATIAGFNEPAYCSFGLTQSFNAPVSEEAAHRYICALNALLDGPRKEKHCLRIGCTTVVFWTDRPCAVEDIFVAFAQSKPPVLEQRSSQDNDLRLKLKAFLEALRKGREAYAELDEEGAIRRYHILGLGVPTPARVAVRFYHEGTLGSLLENLRRHHEDCQIERQFGEESKRPDPPIPPISMLLDQTCPRKAGDKLDRDRMHPILPAAFLEAVISRKRYPDALFISIIRRMVADSIVNYPRAYLIKGHLTRNLGKEIPMSLDASRADPSYRMGRLFAALEKTQRDALGSSLNATVRDRFYASASATPGSVFPRLLRTYQHHLAKLEGGTKINREKLVQEILTDVREIPAHLGLPEQGLFALGYYHQMNAFFQKKDRTDAIEAAQ